jgi:hypothetical protein
MRLYRREHGGAHGPWAQPGLPTDHNRSVKTIRKPTLSLLKIESYQITVNPANLLGWARFISDTLAVETLATTDVETGPKLREHWGKQAFGEYVGKLRSSRNMEDTDITTVNTLTDEVINLNVFRVLMLHKVGWEINNTNIIIVD